MKLKVSVNFNFSKQLVQFELISQISGVPYITATYVHSDILPTFHRRSYWLIEVCLMF